MNEKIYQVIFRSNTSKRTITVKVCALGIVPAIEIAIRKMICKPTKGNFFYPVKAELIA